MCLKRDYGFTFKNIFDTMQAARILGFKHLGLSGLLEGQFRVEPVKSFQKANWGKRPLPEEMKHYARVDTHFLIPLRARLQEQLQKNGVLELAREDFKRLCGVENNHLEVPLYAHVSGYHKLDSQKLAVLNALCVYRDKLAAEANRPHFKIIGSRALHALADMCPNSQEALADVEGLSPRLAKRYGKGLIRAVRDGLSVPPITLKKNKRPSQSYINRIDGLKQWRKEKGKKIGVQSDVILPRDILEKIAGSRPNDLRSLQEMMQEVPWRFNHFGGEILDVITQGRRS